MLIPLPADATQADSLLAPAAEGAHGVLLPTWAYPNPALLQSEDRATTIGELRMVAVRLDPCWPNIAETDLSKCQRVIHVIWQPIVKAWESDATTLAGADAAVHSFYEVSDDEFASVLAGFDDLAASRSIDASQPLQVNPAILSEGLGGAYLTGLEQLVRDHVGADNIFQMTFLALRATLANPYIGQGWLLSGAVFSGGQAFRIPVATVNDDEEHFGNNVSDGTAIEDQTAFLGDFTPASANTDKLLAIVGDSTTAATVPLDQIQAAVDVTLKSENPLMTTLDSVDCMSCHVSTTARNWAVANRGIDITNDPNRYQNKDYDLSLTSDSAMRSNAIHGLGWYGIHSAFSQRTVNDAAAAASFISANVR